MLSGSPIRFTVVFSVVRHTNEGKRALIYINGIPQDIKGYCDDDSLTATLTTVPNMSRVKLTIPCKIN